MSPEVKPLKIEDFACPNLACYGSADDDPLANIQVARGAAGRAMHKTMLAGL